jgi:hypothetical protein
MDVGDILDGTFGTIRRNPRTVIGLAALVVGTKEILSVGAAVATGEIPTALGAFSVSVSLQAVGGIGAVAGLVLSALAGALMTGVMVVVLSEDMFGRRTGSGAVWRRVRPRLAALAAGSLIAGMAPFAGLLLLAVPVVGPLLALIVLVLPGGLLWGAWALTTPALMLEHLGPVRALRRSWRLAVPDFWRIWGIRALAVLLGAVMQSLLIIPFATLGTVLAVVLGYGADDPLPLVAFAFVVLGRILGGIIAEPFLAGVLALLYVDRRMRAEGLDIVLQQRDRSARRPACPGGGWAGPARGGGAVALGGSGP